MGNAFLQLLRASGNRLAWPLLVHVGHHRLCLVSSRRIRSALRCRSWRISVNLAGTANVGSFQIFHLLNRAPQVILRRYAMQIGKSGTRHPTPEPTAVFILSGIDDRNVLPALLQHRFRYHRMPDWSFSSPAGGTSRSIAVPHGNSGLLERASVQLLISHSEGAFRAVTIRRACSVQHCSENLQVGDCPPNLF
uniref:(northern house mosquito) hypothetical protein n=1 Tax=Culex pipiens TaxID=7175 RepID=A0A8D8CC12_CULPI